jgi:hypothetical protein
MATNNLSASVATDHAIQFCLNRRAAAFDAFAGAAL